MKVKTNQGQEQQAMGVQFESRLLDDYDNKYDTVSNYGTAVGFGNICPNCKINPATVIVTAMCNYVINTFQKDDDQSKLW